MLQGRLGSLYWYDRRKSCRKSLFQSGYPYVAMVWQITIVCVTSSLRLTKHYPKMDPVPFHFRAKSSNSIFYPCFKTQSINLFGRAISFVLSRLFPCSLQIQKHTSLIWSTSHTLTRKKIPIETRNPKAHRSCFILNSCLVCSSNLYPLGAAHDNEGYDIAPMKMTMI